MNRTWIIIGATSIIAEEFARLAAIKGNSIRLVGRNQAQMNIIANDLCLRYQVSCSVYPVDLLSLTDQNLKDIFERDEGELDLLLAHSDFTGNNHLIPQTISDLILTNILTTTLLIDYYLKLEQKNHYLIYLSSVAACRGRAKNSLYGATKSAIEIYLEGLQQAAPPEQSITIAKLGFIDTKQTYGLPGIFYAAPPKDCAKACFQAVKKGKRRLYFPWFWMLIMGLIKRLPFFVYKKMKNA